jgi:integrase
MKPPSSPDDERPNSLDDRRSRADSEGERVGSPPSIRIRQDRAVLIYPAKRHSPCASLSLAVIHNLHAVKERLGHEDIRTTTNVYGHLVPSFNAALTDGLNSLFIGSRHQSRSHASPDEMSGPSGIFD